MNWIEVLRLIALIASGLAASIPLVIKLVEKAEQVVKERNWMVVVDKVLELMEIAESKFDEGAERKEWVIAMLKACAGGINYDIDYDVIAEMIDRLCDMSKIVNGSVKTAQPQAD